MTYQLVFNYTIPRIGNGFQTRIPNLKNDSLILQQIEFDLDKKTDQPCGRKASERVDRPELEVTLKHGGNTTQYHIGYFQFFDRINLSNYWYRLADADEVELIIKNKSNKQQEIAVTYTYAESTGIIIHSSSLRAGDFKESTLLTDLTNGWIPQKLYLKSSSSIRAVKLIPKFKIINQLENESYDPATYQQLDINQNEVLLNFAEPELAEFLPMLGYYQLDIDFADPEQTLHLLAYGFKR